LWPQLLFFKKLSGIIQASRGKGEKTLQNPPEECSVHNYLIDPYQIHYLRFIIEAYPGLAVVSTVNPKLGLVSITVAPGCEQDVLQILEAERDTLKLTHLDNRVAQFT
jgi:hypothetical protein